VKGRDRGKTSSCRIHVQDNGKGISPAIHDKVFSPFCTTKARGIGLGLPLVRRTVLDHNGQVDIRTSSKGTTVTLSLPFAEVEREVAHEASARRG
jgi:nitrogen-specific signal transduction histidine kinase